MMQVMVCQQSAAKRGLFCDMERGAGSGGLADTPPYAQEWTGGNGSGSFGGAERGEVEDEWVQELYDMQGMVSEM